MCSSDLTAESPPEDRADAAALESLAQLAHYCASRNSESRWLITAVTPSVIVTP